ncbi:MAG: HDOD domain-containing protein [Planctomycetaceae bacterium]
MQAVQTEIDLPPVELRKSLFAKSGELSMLPAVAAEALKLVKDPECTAARLSGVVEQDMQLATDILTLANSAVFACGQPVAHLQQAIARLGFVQCRNLILSSSASSLMKKLPTGQDHVREKLWKHSVMTATACMHLNQTLRLGCNGEEYTAGLLHDLGRLLLAAADPDRFAQVDKLDFDETEDDLAAERAVFQIDHAAFGAWFASHNKLPESLVSATAWHHEPTIDHPHQQLIAVTAAGDHMANYLQRHGTSEGYQPQTNPGICALPQSVLLQFAGIAHKLMDDILAEVESH